MIAVERNDEIVADTGPDTPLEQGSVLLALGTDAQVAPFRELYGYRTPLTR